MVVGRRSLARGIEVSELGFGAAPLGGEYGPIDQETSNAVCDYCIFAYTIIFPPPPFKKKKKKKNLFASLLLGKRPISFE